MILLHVAMSLDDLIAGPGHDMSWTGGAEYDTSSQLADEVAGSTGVVLAGRGWYEVASADEGGAVAGIYLRRGLVRTGSRLDASSGAARVRRNGGGRLGPRDRVGARRGTRRRSSGEHLRCRRCSPGAGAWSARRDRRADRPSHTGRWGAAVRRGAGSPSQAGAHVRRYERDADGHPLSSRRPSISEFGLDVISDGLDRFRGTPKTVRRSNYARRNGCSTSVRARASTAACASVRECRLIGSRQEAAETPASEPSQRNVATATASSTVIIEPTAFSRSHASSPSTATSSRSK